MNNAFSIRGEGKNEGYFLIRLILFDLGKVILDFSYHKIAEGMARHSRQSVYQDPDNIINYILLKDSKLLGLYEEGKMTSGEFFLSMKEIFGLDISFSQFEKIWNEVFTENGGMGDLIRSLKKDFTLFLLSNTNELHFGYVKRQFPVVHEFDRWILSYEAGVRKPDPEIFKIALNKAGVQPEEAIFIDDIKGHVIAAENIGIHAVEFKSVEQITRYIKEKAYESSTR